MVFLRKTLAVTGLISIGLMCTKAFAELNYPGAICQHQGSVFGTPWPEKSWFNTASDYNNIKITRYGFENNNPVIESGFLRGTEITATEAAICPFSVSDSVGAKLKVTVVMQDLHRSSRCRGTIRTVDGGPLFTGNWVVNSDTTSTTYAKVVVLDETVSNNGIGLIGAVECELAGQMSGDNKLTTIRAIKLE